MDKVPQTAVREGLKIGNGTPRPKGQPRPHSGSRRFTAEICFSLRFGAVHSKIGWQARTFPLAARGGVRKPLSSTQTREWSSECQRSDKTPNMYFVSVGWVVSLRVVTDVRTLANKTMKDHPSGNTSSSFFHLFFISSCFGCPRRGFWERRGWFKIIFHFST